MAALRARMSRLVRTFRVAAPIAVVFALLSQTGAFAATVNVSMTSSLRFSPDPAKAKLGDTITWTNTSSFSHTTTQDSPLSLWDSGTVGAGGTFSAGMDLKAFAAGEVPTAEGRGFGGITERPPAKPVVAAVEGYALAGGFELVLACDLVAASEHCGVREAGEKLAVR